MAAAIQVSNLTHHYSPDRRALDHVSFSVPKGTIHGLLGPNGSGKTTLFRLLSTIAPVQEGTITVANLDVATQRAQVRQKLGVVFQSPAVDIHLTALENLTHHGHLYGLSGSSLRERATSALDALGLADRAKEKVKTFSGGMKRRVELAKALLHDPEVMLLDEPSTGLDPAARLDLWTQLRKAREKTGVTMLLSTHLMDEAERCDHLTLLSQGKLVAHDTPTALKQALGSQILRITASDPAAALATLATEYPPATFTRHGDLLRAELAHAAPELPRIAGLLQSNLLEITLGQPTLEDVFLHLTGHSLHSDQSLKSEAP